MSAFFSRFLLDERALKACKRAVGACVVWNQVARFSPTSRPFLWDDVLPLAERSQVFRFSAYGHETELFPYLSRLFCYTWSDSVAFQLGTEILLLLVGVALLLGQAHRLTMVLCWLLLASQQTKNPYVLLGGDAVLRLLSFWLIFPTTKETPPAPAEAGGFYPSVSPPGGAYSWGVTVQMLLLYTLTTLLKSGADWRVDGTALEKTLSIESLTTPVGQALLAWAPAQVLRYASHGALLLEEVVPWLVVLLPHSSWWRFAAVVVMMLFHLSIACVLRIPYFQTVMITLWVAFLPTVFWDKLSGTRWTANAADRPRQTNPTVEFILSLLVGYCVLWNVTTLPVRWRRWLPPSFLYPGLALRLDQTWGMFSPTVRTDDGWMVAEGVRADGSTVVFDAYAENEVGWTRPLELRTTYRDRFWREFLIKLYMYKPPVAVNAYARWLQARWNAEPSHAPVKAVNLYYMQVDRYKPERGVVKVPLQLPAQSSAPIRAQPSLPQIKPEL